MLSRSCLVITRAGANSLHRHWLANDVATEFDLLICAYHPDAMGEDRDGITHVMLPGTKVAGYAQAFQDFGEKIFSYDYIALLDDDIEASHDTLARCFKAGVSGDFAIWQPSLSWDSYFTYAGLLSVPGLKWRRINFVEMMCPFFTNAALQKVLPLFSGGRESGIDLLWYPTVSPLPCAVIDSVSVRHTRPIGALKAMNGFEDRNYEDDIFELLEEHGLRWPSLVAAEAETVRGRRIGRFETLLWIQQLWGVFTKSPQKRSFRLASDHVRHMISRSFEPVALTANG